jgi:hypothetical protein
MGPGTAFHFKLALQALGSNTGPIAPAYLTYAEAVRGVRNGVECLAGHVTQSSNRLADFGIPCLVHGLGHNRIPQRQFLGPRRLRAYSLVSVLVFLFTISDFSFCCLSTILFIHLSHSSLVSPPSLWTRVSVSVLLLYASFSWPCNSDYY